MTFSLVARCAQSGMFGVAISSSSPAVAARCAYAQAGASPTEVRAILRRSAQHMQYRQVLMVNGQGDTCIHSGPNALGIWAEAQAENVAAGGNLLADAGVPQAMVAGFQGATGHLGDRLLAALHAGLAAGGEAGPVHSAGLLLVDQQSWPLADLRCDWTEACPIAALQAAWQVYKPQINDYVARALNPAAAPSYGVPGDD